MKPITRLTMLSIASALIVGCASAPALVAPTAPPAVTPPAGATYTMTLIGAGELTYECRSGANNATAWAFVSPDAVLTQKQGGARAGKYYGGPTWEGNDGSKVVGKQLAVSPAPAGNIPLQLVEVTAPASSGMFSGVRYIQRLETVGGVAPAIPCTSGNVGTKQLVKYQADYAFYR
jgi:hypothetical protein